MPQDTAVEQLSDADAADEQAEGYRPGYELTAERILEYIAAHGLEPGHRLPTEIELAAELGVSRSVTREAIKILSALGRVRAQRGRGLFVADDPGLLGTSQHGARPAAATYFMPADLDHVMMLFEFRRTQEVELARRAAERATPSELRAIADAVERCNDGALHGDGDSFSSADQDFHLAVAAAGHNPFLTEALKSARQLQHQSTIIGLQGQHADRLAAASAEHAAILEAIRSGLPDAAAAAAAAHIDHSLEDYRKEIQRRLFG